MASNLACVGLAVTDDDDLQRLVARAVRRSRLIGRRGGVAVRRWEDPSGARLVFGMRFGSVLELLPSFAAARGAVLGEIADLNDDVCAAAVLDAQGKQVTTIAFELEERRLLDGIMRAGGPAAIVALGQDVVVHDDDTPSGHPPADIVSIGAFAGSEDAEAVAHLRGVVLHSERRTNTLTRQPFVVARVRTAGCEVQVCLSAAEHPDPLRPGQIIAGNVFLSATLSAARARPGKRRWSRSGLSRQPPPL